MKHPNSFWKRTYYFSLIVFCIGLCIVLANFLTSLKHYSNDVPLTISILIFLPLFHVLTSGFAVFYGLLGSNNGNRFLKRIYYFSIGAFIVLSFAFPLTYFLDIDRLFSLIKPFIISLLFLMFFHVVYSFAAAFSVLYPAFRLLGTAKNIKNRIQARNAAGKIWRRTYYLSVAISFIFLYAFYINDVFSFWYEYSDILVLGLLDYLLFFIYLIFLLNLLNFSFVLFYGLFRRKHKSSFWKRAYSLGVIAFFICFPLPSLLSLSYFHDLLPYISLELRLLLLFLANGVYSLAACFAVFYATLRLKKD